MLNYIKEQISTSLGVYQKILSETEIHDQIVNISKKIVNALSKNNKVLIAGNGGSAADAQHIVGEFVSKFYFHRDALPAVALTTNTSVITAISNDYGFDVLFKRQIEAIGKEGDIFIGISTSGKSKNIIEGLKFAKESGIITIGFTGLASEEVKKLCDFLIEVPSSVTPRIQEAHIMIAHIICAIVEREIFGEGF